MSFLDALTGKYISLLLHLCKYLLVQSKDWEKRYLVNENTSIVASGIGVLFLLEKKKKILKPKLNMINKFLGQIP